MISEPQERMSDLPSLGELREIAKNAKDNETKAQALCLASGVALRMGWPKKAVQLMERAAIVAKCDGVKEETRGIIYQNRLTLLAGLLTKAGMKRVTPVDAPQVEVTGQTAYPPEGKP